MFGSEDVVNTLCKFGKTISFQDTPLQHQALSRMVSCKFSKIPNLRGGVTSNSKIDNNNGYKEYLEFLIEMTNLEMPRIFVYADQIAYSKIVSYIVESQRSIPKCYTFNMRFLSALSKTTVITQTLRHSWKEAVVCGCRYHS